MKRKSYVISIFAFLLCFSSFIPSLFAQTEKEKLFATILLKDSLFWTAYNSCDIEKFKQFFTEDVEFYHDKGGITLGLENLAASLQKNLCSNDTFRLRREAVEGSVRVYPLQNSNVIYGAILSGEHVFYVLEKGKKERLDGLAKFTHLWILKDSVWKISRILSYDHGPAPYKNKRKEIKLPNNILDQFVGKYKGPQSGTLIVQREQNLLVLLIKEKKYILYPESGNLFFTKDRDLTFEFIKNEKKKVSKLLVRENGEIVEDAEFLK